MDTKVRMAVHALIKKGNKYLVTKRSADNDYMPNKWDIPGGTVEIGEDPVDALKREVLEETGIDDFDIYDVLYVYNNMGSFPERQVFQLIYECYVYTDVIRLDDEHSEHRWVTLEEMKELDTIAFLKQYLNS